MLKTSKILEVFLRVNLRNQLEPLRLGETKIEGYTWHHNSQAAPNNFQLLPEKIHNAINHIGEGALSGGK